MNAAGSGLMVGVDLATEPPGAGRARAMVARAEWAALAFAHFDRQQVERIVDAAARAGAGAARDYAERTVATTGVGVVGDKEAQNLAASSGIARSYRRQDFVTPRLGEGTQTVLVPRPVGVVAVAPAAGSPVPTVFGACLLALMTRNAVIVCPDPSARDCSVEAAHLLAEAAAAAGAPAGVIQVVDPPSPSHLDALHGDARVAVVVGGGAVPGRRPGSVPVLVDRTADLVAAARCIVESKSFDNSLPESGESVLVVEAAVWDGLAAHLRQCGAYLAVSSETARLRDLLFPHCSFDPYWAGRDAGAVAAAAGLAVPAPPRLLLAPVAAVGPDEPLCSAKPCPVLAVVTVPTSARGIAAARAVLEIGGSRDVAGIHTADPRAALAFGVAVDAARITVNAGCSSDRAGHPTPDHLTPEHLVRWSRLSYGPDADLPPLPEAASTAAVAGGGPGVPPYPYASNRLPPPGAPA